MSMIKCLFCEATTTRGIGERSGFGQIKGVFGKRGEPNYHAYNIIHCDKHSDEAWEYFKSILKERRRNGRKSRVSKPVI